MGDLITALLLAVSLVTPASAEQAPPASAPIMTPAPNKAEPNEADLQTHGHYVNRAGQDVHPSAKCVDGKVLADASAKCRDGNYSFSKNQRGTCSRHGGVAAWL